MTFVFALVLNAPNFHFLTFSQTDFLNLLQTLQFLFLVRPIRIPFFNCDTHEKIKERERGTKTKVGVGIGIGVGVGVDVDSVQFERVSESQRQQQNKGSDRRDRKSRTDADVKEERKKRKKFQTRKSFGQTQKQKTSFLEKNQQQSV